MTVKIEFLWVGSTSDPHCRALEELYLSRIGRFSRARVSVAREAKKSDPRQVESALRQEEKALLKKIDTSAYLTVLDEGGKQFASRELASWLQKRLLNSGQELVFVGGGHYGLAEGVIRRAQLRLSLGRLTLPHELARVVLLEQVHRAFSIINGLPYQRD